MRGGSKAEAKGEGDHGTSEGRRSESGVVVYIVSCSNVGAGLGIEAEARAER